MLLIIGLTAYLCRNHYMVHKMKRQSIDSVAGFKLNDNLDVLQYAEPSQIELDNSLQSNCWLLLEMSEEWLPKEVRPVPSGEKLVLFEKDDDSIGEKNQSSLVAEQISAGKIKLNLMGTEEVAPVPQKESEKTNDATAPSTSNPSKRNSPQAQDGMPAQNGPAEHIPEPNGNQAINPVLYESISYQQKTSGAVYQPKVFQMPPKAEDSQLSSSPSFSERSNFRSKFLQQAQRNRYNPDENVNNENLTFQTYKKQSDSKIFEFDSSHYRRADTKENNKEVSGFSPIKDDTQRIVYGDPTSEQKLKFLERIQSLNKVGSVFPVYDSLGAPPQPSQDYFNKFEQQWQISPYIDEEEAS